MDSGFGKAAWTQLANQSLLTPELCWEGECIEAPAVLADGGKTWYLSHTRIGFQGGKPMLMKLSIEPGIHQEVVLNWYTKPS